MNAKCYQMECWHPFQITFAGEVLRAHGNNAPLQHATVTATGSRRWLCRQALPFVGAGGPADVLEPQQAAKQGRPGIQPPPPGTASGRIVFRYQFARRQEAVHEHAPGHVTMPALPVAALVVTRAQQLLAFPDAGLDGPACAGQAGYTRRGHGRGTPEPGRHRDGVAVAGHCSRPPRAGWQSQCTRARGCPLPPGTGAKYPRATVPQSPAPPGRQPEPRVSGHFRYVAQARRGHPVQEVDRPRPSAQTPARWQRTVGHQLGQHPPGQVEGRKVAGAGRLLVRVGAAFAEAGQAAVGRRNGRPTGRGSRSPRSARCGLWPRIRPVCFCAPSPYAIVIPHTVTQRELT